MSEQTLFNLEVKQGATYRQPLIWKIENEAGIRTAQPLAGYIAKLQVRPFAGSTTVWATLTSDSPEDAPARVILEKGGVTGAIEIYMGASVTARFSKSGVYDLELHLIGDANEVVPLLGGRVLLESEVTR